MIHRRIALVALPALVAALLACGAPAPEYFGTDFDPPDPAKDFALTDQFGDPFRLVDYRGKVVLLFFGYAHCPDVCPVTLSNWARVEKALGGRDDVAFVFVTVDPERDTVERLREHLAIFSEDFIGLTGTDEQIDPIYERYGIFREKVRFSESAMGYVVDHSTQMIVLDRQGRLRLTLPFNADPRHIVHDVTRVLDEPAPRLRVDDAWARPTAGTMPGAAYFSIVNEGTADDRLVAVESDCCGAVEIHQTRVDGDRMRMVPIADGIAIASGTTVAFEPGGYHVMLIEPAAPLVEGTTIDASLRFELSAPLPLTISVHR